MLYYLITHQNYFYFIDFLNDMYYINRVLCARRTLARCLLFFLLFQLLTYTVTAGNIILICQRTYTILDRNDGFISFPLLIIYGNMWRGR